MEAQFTKTSVVQNFVRLDLGLDADLAESRRNDTTTVDAALPNRIVVERIGRSRHWRT